MKIKMTFYLALASFAGLLLTTGCANNAMLSVPVTVNFGNPPQGGGPCIGRGICKGSVVMPSGTTSAANATGVATVFQLSAADKNDLTMTFSMTDLKNKQPEQVANFVDGGSYNFDAPYDLSLLLTTLKLPPNSTILPTTQSKVEIKGDVVTVHYTYTHK